MTYSADKKMQVRSFYLQGHPLKQAALLVEVNYQTARNWKRKSKVNGDDWDVARSASKLSTGNIADLTASVINDFVVLFESTIKELKSSSDVTPLAKTEAISRLSDAYHKTVNAAGKSSPSLNKLSVAMNVIELLTHYIKEYKPELLSSFIEILEPFGEMVSKEYG